MKLLAAHIRKLRGERGLSQERLAELAQMHRTYLGGIETARRNPSFKNLFRLARALGVSLSELFETVGYRAFRASVREAGLTAVFVELAGREQCRRSREDAGRV